MFTLNDDLSIYATRGDIVFFSVTAEDDGEPYKFKAGDVVRIKIYGKKNAENVVLEKDFPVTEECDEVEIFLDREDTKIGDVISKPKDYWYEVELNPYSEPQTIIGYDEDGAKVFKLFPEGADIPAFEPNPEDYPFIDDELDMTSTRPVQNQAIARAVVSLNDFCNRNKQTITENAESTSKKFTEVENAAAANKVALVQEIGVERARIDNLVSGATVDGSEVVDIRVGAYGHIHHSAGDAVRGQVLSLKEGYYTIYGSDWVQGYMNSSGLQDYKEARIRNDKPIFVKANSVISFEGIGSNHWCVYLLEDDNLDSPTILDNSSDSSYGTCDTFYTAPADGYVMINLQTNETWSEADEDSITPDSFTGYVSIHDYDRICELRDKIAYMNADLYGYTNAAFENVTYTYGKGIVTSKIRLGTPTPIKVSKGDVLYVDGLGDLFWCVNLFATDTITDETSAIESVSWNNVGSYEVPQDGYAVVLLANASTYNDSTAIALEDFTGCVKHLKYDPRIAELSEAEEKSEVNTEKVMLFASYFDSEGDFEPFLFFTDPHLSQGTGWEGEFAEYMECLKQYHESAPIYNIFCGGDWLGNGDTRAEACWKLGYINAQMRSMADYHLVVGNHDTNEQGRLDDESEKWTGALPNDVISNLWYRPHGNPYYSFDTTKTRFFILNSGKESYVADNDQYAWFADSLLANTANNIILFFHIVRNSSGVVQTFANTVTAIAKAFNDRSTITVAGKSYNFANAKGNVRFAMAGHRHEDWSGEVNGIPVVETTHMRDGDVPTFDLCFADYSKGVLNLVRVGTGENRNIAI